MTWEVVSSFLQNVCREGNNGKYFKLVTISNMNYITFVQIYYIYYYYTIYKSAVLCAEYEVMLIEYIALYQLSSCVKISSILLNVVMDIQYRFRDFLAI